MHIEEELVDWLDRSIPNSDQNKVRNKKIVLSYYGFEEVPWPTYEELAEKFGIGSREWVRRIIKDNFRSLVTINDLPTAVAVFNAIESQHFVTVVEFSQQLLRSGLTSEKTNIKGLLNLAGDFDRCQNYDAYNSDLQVVTRSGLRFDGPSYLIKSEAFVELKAHWQKARKLPGQLGLAKFEYLQSELGSNVDSNRVIQVIRSTPKSCVIEDTEGEWYVFDDKENTLVNSCEKIFSIIPRCDIRVLSEVLANSLRRRTNPYTYPTQSVIAKWIEQSGRFVVENSVVSFLGERRELTDIENAVLKYFERHSSSDYTSFKDHLLGLGYGKPAVNKVKDSPIVYVDKSSGKKAFTYQLITGVASFTSESNVSGNRYQLFKNRLKRLLGEGTDADINTTSRREQGILQDWLFSNEAVGRCAICGNQFSTSALVVAHKKKRALCTEAERVDPYVVFPLCNFGCDYLYERDIIRIVDGEVQCGELPEQMTFERDKAISLTGRKIAGEWLQGPDSYFRRDPI